MSHSPMYDLEPATEQWGICPECGASQEDADDIDHGRMWRCPCRCEYTDDQAFPDLSQDEPPDFDERRAEREVWL